MICQRVLTIGEVLADSNYKEKKDSVAHDKVNLILEEFSTASYSSNIIEYWFSKVEPGVSSLLCLKYHILAMISS